MFPLLWSTRCILTPLLNEERTMGKLLFSKGVLSWCSPASSSRLVFLFLFIITLSVSLVLLSPEPSCWASGACFFSPTSHLPSLLKPVLHYLSNCVMLNDSSISFFWNIWILATKSCLSPSNCLCLSPSNISTGEWRRQHWKRMAAAVCSKCL